MAGLKNVITRIKALITADNKDFKKKMKDTQDTTRKTGASFKQMGNLVKGVVGAVIVRQLVRMGKALLDVGKSMDLMNLKANTVFGAYRKEVDRMAQDTAGAMGLTNTEFINAAAGIQDLLIPMGFARKQATGMTTELMSLSGALSVWSGGQYSAAEVGQIFTKAMLGEREQLKSLGISITEAEVQARLLEKGQKNLTGQYLAQAKAQATLELITEKSTDAQAAFGDAQGNMITTSAQVGANIRSLAENLTVILEPAFRVALTAAQNFTSELRTMMEDAAMISKSDVLTTWEKWEYRLAGVMGGAAGAAKQMEILGMAMSAEEFDRTVDSIVQMGGSLEDVEKALAGFGEKALEHGRKYYQESAKLFTKSNEEEAQAAEAAANERLAKEAELQGKLWTLSEQTYRSQQELAKDLPGFTAQNEALAAGTEALKAYNQGMRETIGIVTEGLEPMRVMGEGIETQAEKMMKWYDDLGEKGKTAMDTMAMATLAAGDAFVDASLSSSSGLREMASAAVTTAKRIISAKIAEGVANAVASALTKVPFPFNIVAGGLAGAGAAALFNKMIPSFAEGGMVTEPTLAMVGDNPSGKEMIIPWEKLGEMGGGSVEVGGVLRGNDMYLQNKRTQDKLNRTGRG